MPSIEKNFFPDKHKGTPIPPDVLLLADKYGLHYCPSWPLYSLREVIDAIDNMDPKFAEDYDVNVQM